MANASLQCKDAEWNPMKEAYRDSEFNTYDSGPGAAIGDARANIKPYLVIKYPPSSLTKKAVHNLCAQHGRVLGVRYREQNNYFFVDMATVSDMEAAFRALEHNSYGFTVLIGKQKNEQQMRLGEKQPNMIEQVECNSKRNDMQLPRREQYERPKFAEKPIVTQKEYAANSLLQLNDPQRHFLIETDAHAVERSGLTTSQQQRDEVCSENLFRAYHTGRAYVKIPDNTRKFLEEKHSQSVGSYSADQRAYINNKNSGSTNVGKCEECQQIADVVCGRCGTFYCGIECQRKNWAMHRIMCGKPRNARAYIGESAPSLAKDSLQSIKLENQKPRSNNEVNMSTFIAANDDISQSDASQATALSPTNKLEIQMPRSGNEVYITSFTKSNVVFIRPITYESNIQFLKLLSDINAAAKALHSLDNYPKIGQIVLTKFEEQLNRAMILNVQSATHIKVVAIDYGNIDVKRLEDLYEAPNSINSIPRMSLPVILKDVPDVVLTDELRNAMNLHLDDISLRIVYKPEDYIVEKGVHRVELFDDSIGKSLNKLLITIIKPIEPMNDEFYDRSYLKQISLPNGEDVNLVVMDNSLNVGFISCTTREYALEIQKIQSAVQRYAETLQPQMYTPRVDELCIAKYSLDNKWYRGRCIEVVGNGTPAILFIDYGNIDNVSISDIRRYPRQFQYPIYTRDCEIEGLPEKCSEQQVEKLKELLPVGGKIVCDKVTTNEEENYHIIKLDRVIKELKLHDLL